MLDLAGYAQHIGKTERTVWRYVEPGAQTIVPGAQKIDGQWWFPSDAQPVKATSTDVAVTSQSPDAAPADVATLRTALDALPAMLDVTAMARVLGISEGAVREHADELGGRRWGRLVFPQRVVRELAGLVER